MDIARFDALSRHLASRASRRGLLTIVTGGLAVSAPWLFSEETAGEEEAQEEKEEADVATNVAATATLYPELRRRRLRG